MGNADNDLSNRCIVIQDDELVFVLLAWRAASGFGDDFSQVTWASTWVVV